MTVQKAEQPVQADTHTHMGVSNAAGKKEKKKKTPFN